MIKAKRMRAYGRGYDPDRLLLVIECEGFCMMSSKYWASEGEARDAAIELADTIERSLYAKDGNAVVKIHIQRSSSDEYQVDEVVRYNTEPAVY